MSTAAAIRLQIETTLAKRVPAALTLKIRQAPELFSTGIGDVDTMLGGGISNAIIHPKVYEQYRMAVTRGKFLLLEGTLQNQDGVISVKATAVRVLELGPIDMRSHDFH